MFSLIDCFTFVPNYEIDESAKAELREYWIRDGEKIYQALIGIKNAPWSYNVLLEYFHPEYRGRFI